MGRIASDTTGRPDLTVLRQLAQRLTRMDYIPLGVCVHGARRAELTSNRFALMEAAGKLIHGCAYRVSFTDPVFQLVRWVDLRAGSAALVACQEAGSGTDFERACRGVSEPDWVRAA